MSVCLILLFYSFHFPIYMQTSVHFFVSFLVGFLLLFGWFCYIYVYIFLNFHSVLRVTFSSFVDEKCPTVETCLEYGVQLFSVGKAQFSPCLLLPFFPKNPQVWAEAVV